MTITKIHMVLLLIKVLIGQIKENMVEYLVLYTTDSNIEKLIGLINWSYRIVCGPTELFSSACSEFSPVQPQLVFLIHSM